LFEIDAEIPGVSRNGALALKLERSLVPGRSTDVEFTGGDDHCLA
jgi:hypothetical protein